MGEVTLDKKYRPQALDQVVGNTEAVQAITIALNREQEYPASTLLQGPSGCGKTTLARIIANQLGATGRDLKQYNISNMRGIDAARTIIDLVGIAPWGERRVIILNECHKATNEFQNAMLEVLEEPPPRNHFILCTTEPGKLLKTIRTRCTVFTVTQLVKRDLISLVTWVMQQEGANLPEQVVTAIADGAAGSPRQALVILDAVIDLATVEEQLAVASSYHYDEAVVFDLANALLNKVAWGQVAKLIKGLNAKDAEDIRYAMLGILERSLLAGGKQADRAAAIMDFFAASFYNTGRPGLTQACWFALKA